MVVHLPPKPHAKAKALRPRKPVVTINPVDWLGLWALSLGVCAIILAGVVYVINGDNVGASWILAGTAAIIAFVVRFGAARDELRDKD
jgi:hypothetical protein